MSKRNQSSRLFESDLLESLTHVHPIIPLLMWGPIAGYLLYRSIFVQGLSTLDILIWILVGFFVWTFTEYFLHRFVFHFNAKSRFGKRLIYLFHGIHHDEPDDPTRLVMPPFPALVIMAALYFVFSLVIPMLYMNVFMFAFIVGYLTYDYIHYATHHFPMTSKVGRYLKKYHLRHHHAKEHSKYGVSNPLWDYIFFTVTGPKKDHK